MGLSIAGAARLAGIPRAYLSMIEAGKRSPNPQILLQLMRSLSLPPAAWLSEYLADETRCQHIIRLAQALFEGGDLDSARRALSKAFFVSRFNYDGRYNADVYLLLGRVYYAQGQYNRALRWLRLMERATRHAPDSHVQSIAAFNHAQSLAKVGQRLEALKKFDQAIDGFGKFQQRRELGTAWYAKANVLLGMHLYAEAYEAYRRAAHYLRKLPFHAEAQLGEAITISVLQGPQAACSLFERIVYQATRPITQAKARTNLATALRQLGRHEEALTYLNAALSSSEELPGPIVAALLSESTICHLRMGDREAATQTLLMYKQITGPKDSEDIAAMHIIAGILGISPPEDPIPPVVEDDFEQRVKAALELLTSPRAVN